MFASRRRAHRVALAAAAVLALAAACSSPSPVEQVMAQATAISASIGNAEAAVAAEPDPRVDTPPTTAGPSTPGPTTPGPTTAATDPAGANPTDLQPTDPSADGTLTINFAGDVNFSERTADRLAADPLTAFGVAAPGLAAADLTVVNLETAITTGGEPEPKSYTFRAPPSAFTALKAAGVDVASMANNHGADYGEVGLRDTLAAIDASGFPVIGIGADQARALTPYRTTINGVDVAIFAASAVHDHTLATWTATADTPGIASAFDPLLPEAVAAEAAKGSTVIVFLHWGTEYDSCPDGDQQQLASELAGAGASAVIGTHAHVLQGAGWRGDGVYVAYGLSNYLWWRSFGNEQDDNGVLTLTVKGKDVTAASFAPSHLDDTGVPVPATGAEAARINAQWEQVRDCTDLTAAPPS